MMGMLIISLAKFALSVNKKFGRNALETRKESKGEGASSSAHLFLQMAPPLTAPDSWSE